VLVERAAGEALDAVVGEDVAIRGDDGVVFAAERAGFFVDGGGLGELRRGGRAFTRRLLIVAEGCFCHGVAFTCWMGAEQVYQPDFGESCLWSLL